MKSCSQLVSLPGAPPFSKPLTGSINYWREFRVTTCTWLNKKYGEDNTFIIIIADALLVSCCDLYCSKELFITLKVLNEWSMNAINTSLLYNLFNCVNAITDMLLKPSTICHYQNTNQSACAKELKAALIQQYLCYWYWSYNAHNIIPWLHYKACQVYASRRC